MRWVTVLWLVALALLGGCDDLLNLDTVPAEPDQGIAFVQAKADNTVGNDMMRAVTLPSPTTDGDLIVAFVAWGFTFNGIDSVTDSQGNAYKMAGSSNHQAVYYAENIKGGPTTVTLALSSDTSGPDLRVIEYTGLALTNALEKHVEQSGTGTKIDSGPITTKHGYDLLVAGTSVGGQTDAAGPDFTQRLLTPGNGSLAEDRIVTAAGDYDATTTQTSSPTDFWTIDVLAFRGARTSPP